MRPAPGLGPQNLTTLLAGPQIEVNLDGWCNGPLFAPPVKTVRKVRGSGGKEVWAKYIRARPPWANLKAINGFWKQSMRRTAETGVQHSVDHIVPLIHPFVCGLHVENNLRIIPLADNIRKSNSTWPMMWSEQQELF